MKIFEGIFGTIATVTAGIFFSFFLTEPGFAQSNAEAEKHLKEQIMQMQADPNYDPANGQALIDSYRQGIGQNMAVGAPEGIDLFQGCQNNEAQPAANAATPRERIANLREQVDPISERVFASLSLNELEALPEAEKQAHCWFRLDGLWVENKDPAFRSDYKPKGWIAGSDSQNVINLSHGVYTRPKYLIVLPSSNSNEVLEIRDVLENEANLRMVSVDGIDLKDVLVAGGKTKTYKPGGTHGSDRFGRALTIRVAGRSGRVRMTFAGVNYERPKPAISKQKRDEQLENSDSFLIGNTMENLVATRKGYDLTTQSPEDFMINPKEEVFAKHGTRDYYIDEKRIIPLGLKLKKGGQQASVIYNTLISNGRQMQEAVSSSFGSSKGFGIDGSAGGQEAGGSLNVKASYGAGSGHSKQKMNALTSSNSVAEIFGYSRYKKHILITDYAFISLSEDFMDAIDEAVASGKYKELINRFGTHYSYATTYGSAGQVSSKVSSTFYTESQSNSNTSNSSKDASILIYNETENAMRGSNVQSGTTVKKDYGTATFFAVGGNGSWDEKGFSAGDAAYPILTDMRPLHELLNPIFFPGEPRIYVEGREDFRKAIAKYLDEAGGTLSPVSIIPGVSTWRYQPVNLSCYSAGSEGDNTLEIAGTLTLQNWAEMGRRNTPATDPLFNIEPWTFFDVPHKSPKVISCNDGENGKNNEIDLRGAGSRIYYSNIKGIQAQLVANLREMDGEIGQPLYYPLTFTFPNASQVTGSQVHEEYRQINNNLTQAASRAGIPTSDIFTEKEQLQQRSGQIKSGLWHSSPDFDLYVYWQLQRLQ